MQHCAKAVRLWLLSGAVACAGLTACAGQRPRGTYVPPHPRVETDLEGLRGHGLAEDDGPIPENEAAKKLGLPQSARRCYDRLWHSGVTFELVYRAADAVRMPIRVTSPIGGVWVQPINGNRVNAVLDCRLALRLLAWAPDLERHGVKVVEHYSAYRPGATIAGSDEASAHASALAIDVSRLQLNNGDVLDVLTDWEGRGRGEPPCPLRRDEGWASRTLRGLVCDAVDQGLFQIVLTPHHDDAHQNHVHLEFRPDASWTYVR